MSQPGFTIAGVQVRNGNGEPAELLFEPGLNVLTGASDTGKSYLLHVLEYVLGRTTPPKAIPEDGAYSWVMVGLNTDRGQRFVLRRSLRQAEDVELYHSSLANWGIHLESRTLSGQGTETDSLSTFILSLCGLNERRIRTNARNSTEVVSFRHLRPFVFINETRIISEESPARPSGQYTDATKEDSTLKLLLTGKDDSDRIARPDTRLEKASWKGRTEILDRMILQTRSEIALEEGQGQQAENQIREFEERLQEIQVRLARTSSLVAELTAGRETRWRELQKLGARNAVISQLLTQFDLLRKQYESDASRLQFIAEGEYLLAQVGPAKCPMCHQHVAAGSHLESYEPEVLRAAIFAELGKLDGRRLDLASTMANLETERSSNDGRIGILRAEVGGIDADLSDRLRPQVLADSSALKAIENSRGAVIRLKFRRERLGSLEAQRAGLGPEPKATRAPKAERSVAESTARRELCSQIEKLLTSWRFPQVGVVEFDGDMNLTIAGVPAKSHGKGYRALIHAAFTVALMLCGTGNGHPGFVVIDSPLTSFRGKDAYEASDDVQRSFFESLCNLDRKFQVIVIENKEPPPDLINLFHYMNFTGVLGKGRSGFYPG